MRFFLLFVAFLLLNGCQRAAPKSDQTLMVFAASSLTESFQQIAEAFQNEHAGVDITLHFAGSQALRTQIENGAPADVFASANPAHLDALFDAKLLQTPAIFAHNRL